ncbi:hypothetical protein GCM10025864_11030 [Luteimicrobium album]|uniref:Nucleotidyltransferase n=1 Tax=Luteimicrobium album TaxID=1054550 RepID=A0ABQ6I0M8_9MICO|nr:hypothetical protein [Luteimicrobium album]GMA23344.1 hypothetical protein GCM10025864_11030 [Luteimicrobium album]
MPNGLATENDIERVILRLAGQNPKHFGRDFAKRIDHGAKLAAGLRKTVRGPILISTEVAMRRGATSVGDLDVVLVDPAERTGLAIECSGGIGTASGWEFDSARAKLEDKLRTQLPRLQSSLADRAVHKDFPHGWPDPEDIAWNWAVAGSSFQGWDLGPSGLFEASLDIASYLGPYDRLSDLVARLRDPDPGCGYEVEHHRQRMFDFDFGIDRIEVARGRRHRALSPP